MYSQNLQNPRFSKKLKGECKTFSERKVRHFWQIQFLNKPMLFYFSWISTKNSLGSIRNSQVPFVDCFLKKGIKISLTC